MGTSDKPVLFEVKVDTKTGEIDLKKFQGKVDESMRQSAASVNKFESALKTGAAQATAFLGVLGIAAGVHEFVAGLRDAIKGASEQEQAERKLATSLQARGIEVEKNLDQMKRLATQMEFNVGIDDDMILSQEAVAVRLLGTAQAAEKLVGVSADVAAALGRDFEQTSFAITRAITSGSAVALQKLGVHLDETVAKSHNANRILGELEKRFGGSAASSLKTFDGSMKLLSLAFGEFKEALGDLIVRSPAVREFIDGLRVAILGLTDAFNAPGAREGVKNLTLALLDFTRVALLTIRFAGAVGAAIVALKKDLIDDTNHELFPNLRQLFKEQPEFDKAIQASAIGLDKLRESISKASTTPLAITAQKGAVVTALVGDEATIGFGIDALLKLQEGVQKLEVAYRALQGVGNGKAFEFGLKTLREEALKLYELGAAPSWFKGLQVPLAQLEKSQAIIDVSKQVSDLSKQESTLNELFRVGAIDAAQYAIGIKVVMDQYHALAQKAIEASAAMKKAASFPPLDAYRPPSSPADDQGVPFNPVDQIPPGYHPPLALIKEENEKALADLHRQYDDFTRLTGIVIKFPDIPPQSTPFDLLVLRNDNAITRLWAQMREIEKINATAIATWQGQTLILAGSSQVFAENWTAMYDAIQASGDALSSAGFEKAAKAIRKVQAGMLLVSSVISIYEGAIKIATGIYPPNPPLIASGAAMIAKGAAGLAQARSLGSSGASASAGAAGGAGGGAGAGSGGQAVNYAGAVRTPTGNATGTTPVVSGQPEVHNHYHSWDVKGLDGDDVVKTILQPKVRRAINTAVTIERSGR